MTIRVRRAAPAVGVEIAGMDFGPKLDGRKPLIISNGEAEELRDELNAFLDQPSEPAAATETPSDHAHMDVLERLKALEADSESHGHYAVGMEDRLSLRIDQIAKNAPVNGAERLGVLEMRVDELVHGRAEDGKHTRERLGNLEQLNARMLQRFGNVQKTLRDAGDQ